MRLQNNFLEVKDIVIGKKGDIFIGLGRFFTFSTVNSPLTQF
jgi:hypothetical protein